LHYQKIQPSATAARLVEFYWALEDTEPQSAVQIVIPDGRAGMIFNFARPFESIARGVWSSQPECFFVGQITGPLLLRPLGITVMIGVQFWPHGAAQVFESPIYELNDLAIDLRDYSQKLRLEFERIRNFRHYLSRCKRLMR
jgi:hypothetical protein